MGEMRIGQGRDAVKAYMQANPDFAEKVEEEIRANAFKLMSKQSQIAAKAAGRAVDVAADDFEE
jgi:recombination protein RecA